MASHRATPTAASTEDLRPRPRHWFLLFVVLLAAFIAVFDLFVVNIAVPVLRIELRASETMLALTVSGYAFAYGAGLVTGARLGDRFGYRRVFVLGLAAFTLASLLCGLAMTSQQLVAARLLQGLTAAAMVPQVLSLITIHFGREHRGRATAWYGAVSGLGAIAGQILGGMILQADLFGLGWRPIFFVNVPVGVVAVILARYALPAGGARSRGRFDPGGAVGVSATLALVLVPLALGPETGWTWWIWGLLALSPPTATLTLWWQVLHRRRGGEPILDPDLLRNRSYTRLLLAAACYQLYFGSLLFSVTLLVQTGMGADPFRTALVLLPQGVLFTIGSMLSGTAVARHGPGVMVAGAGIAIVGLLLILAELIAYGQQAGSGGLTVPLALIGLGNGLLLPPMIGAALARVRPEQAGTASGAFTTSQQFANALGVTAIGSFFFAVAGPGVANAPRAMITVGLVHIALVLAATRLLWTACRPGGRRPDSLEEDVVESTQVTTSATGPCRPGPDPRRRQGCGPENGRG